MRVLIVFIVLMIFAMPIQAKEQAEPLTVDLAQKSVDITTDFNGAYLQLFGVQDQPGDIAIVIRGPDAEMLVRQKERIFGVWTNLSGIRFKDVPVYYDYALADPSLEQSLPEVFKSHDIGLTALKFESEDDHKEEELKTFKDALIRNKKKEGRYPEKPESIEFLSDNFFKTSFYIPPNVPIGKYKIQTFLINNGAVQDVKTTNVTVGQVGLSAGIHGFSRRSTLIYGFSCVIFAMFMGWMSNAIRNRM